MLALIAILTLNTVDTVARAIQLWKQSCASPDASGLCAQLVPLQPLAADHTLRMPGADLECRVEDDRVFLNARQRQPRDDRSRQAVALLGHTAWIQLRTQDAALWAQARVLQGDQLFEDMLTIAKQPPHFVRIVASPAEDDAPLQRRLEQARKGAERRNAYLNRLLATRLSAVIDRANRARAIYEDVRQHGPPEAIVVAFTRLGQLDADLEHAIHSSTRETCATKANWRIWKDAFVEPPDERYVERSKQELMFCLAEAKRLMLVDRIEMCESELQRIAPGEYPLPAEIIPQPRP